MCGVGSVSWGRQLTDSFAATIVSTAREASGGLFCVLSLDWESPAGGSSAPGEVAGAYWTSRMQDAWPPETAGLAIKFYLRMQQFRTISITWSPQSSHFISRSRRSDSNSGETFLPGREESVTVGVQPRTMSVATTTCISDPVEPIAEPPSEGFGTQ
jgi:hypothetical protein